MGPSAGADRAPAEAPNSAAQLEAPATGANELNAQAAQPAALAVPGLVTEPAKPGAQTAQAATEGLPGPVVEMPGGHEVQLAAFARENVPAAQATHPRALAVPGLSTAPTNPGAQMLQADTDVIPVAELAV